MSAYNESLRGMFSGIKVNKKAIEKIIHDKIRLYLHVNEDITIKNIDFEFAKCGDKTYEVCFMKEFESKFIIRLNNDKIIYDDIIENLVDKYLDEKWINVLT